MTEIKFNPCPLCGKTPNFPIPVFDEPVFNEVYSSRGRSNVEVYCLDCSLSVLVYTSHYPDLHDYHSFVQVLAEKWNRLSARGSNVENPT